MTKQSSRRHTRAMHSYLKTAAILGVTAAFASITPARASLLSVLPVSGEQDRINDLGGNTPPAGLPLGLSGYTSESWTLVQHPVGPPTPTPQLVAGPNLLAGGAGNYTFTYLGNGNAAHHDTIDITVPGGATVHFDSASAVANVTHATVFATMAGEIQFTYRDLTDGGTISSSPSAANNTFNASYFLGMSGSTGCTNNTDPNTDCSTHPGVPLTGPGGAAYIGFADDPWNTVGADHDFQDLGVLVATPEPASLALIGIGLAGVGLVRRRRKVA